MAYKEGPTGITWWKIFGCLWLTYAQALVIIICVAYWEYPHLGLDTGLAHRVIVIAALTTFIMSCIVCAGETNRMTRHAYYQSDKEYAETLQHKLKDVCWVFFNYSPLGWLLLLLTRLTYR